MERKIHGVTEEERLYLKQLTAASLPNSPRDFGMKAGQIKPKFWKALTEGKGSVVWLINRVIDDLNAILGNAGSIYDLAVAYGFEGTETEWLESLKGEQGVGVSGADVLNNVLVLELTNGERLHSTLGGMATTAELEAALAAAKAYTDEELAEFDFVKIVDSLPAEGLPNRIYLVPKADAGTQDLFDEYLWANGAWEYIDTKHVAVELTGYVQKEEGKGLSANDLTDALKTNYDAAYTHSVSTHTIAQGGTGATTAVAARTALGAAAANHTHDVPYDSILDAVYPVGSIYLSMTSTNPANVFGVGTWVQVSQGRYLIGVGTNAANSGSTSSKYGWSDASDVVVYAGDMGGEAKHRLTESEMPSHDHQPEMGWWNSSSGVAGFGTGAALVTENNPNQYWSRTSKAGGDAAHNNMPPYFAVYMWRRTA